MKQTEIWLYSKKAWKKNQMLWGFHSHTSWLLCPVCKVDENKGKTEEQTERDQETAHKQIHIVAASGSQQSGLAAVAASVLSSTVLRSPDSLMLLCEFSSLLFLDPASAERVEKREE